MGKEVLGFPTFLGYYAGLGDITISTSLPLAADMTRRTTIMPWLMQKRVRG